MSDSKVFSLPIVVRFDVFKDSGIGHIPSRVSFSMNELDFQGMKKALRHGVIIAVGFASHATAQTVALDQSLISL